ncbi:hypothetical protein UVI_02045880 [Ustilaginoidea virens]|uniref:Uncharacterized protein n=1 Tax=Ustilaginoidea virens TaxID=1159556 RepID=A0A1B5L8J3_USTVR|nr:hypothetical protein UVI_02045880 [Ustilaginoidea virens]
MALVAFCTLLATHLTCSRKLSIAYVNPDKIAAAAGLDKGHLGALVLGQVVSKDFILDKIAAVDDVAGSDSRGKGGQEGGEADDDAREMHCLSLGFYLGKVLRAA